MYEYIFKNIQPRDYEGWQEASIQQQKVFVHMKSRLEQFNPRRTATTGFNSWKGNNTNRWCQPNIPNLPDPNAMDLSPGRARLAQAEDYEPGKNCYQPTGEARQLSVILVGQRKVLKCFNCDKPGHFKRDCRQPLRPNSYYQTKSRSSACLAGRDKEDDFYAAAAY
jgi:hypothetical protein